MVFLNLVTFVLYIHSITLIRTTLYIAIIHYKFPYFHVNVLIFKAMKIKQIKQLISDDIRISAKLTSYDVATIPPVCLCSRKSLAPFITFSKINMNYVYILL